MNYIHFVKLHIRGHVNLKMKELIVCSPCSYASEDTQYFIRQRCLDGDKQWIYHLIECSDIDAVPDKEEKVYINKPEWMLCLDIHPGKDTRYLVVFKDHSLKTIRNLDGSHLKMLWEIKRGVEDFLKARHENSWKDYNIYFHYMPSVFQLHAHVSNSSTPSHVVRRHNINHVIRFIQSKPDHFKHALILTTSSRNTRTTQANKPAPQICVTRTGGI